MYWFPGLSRLCGLALLASLFVNDRAVYGQAADPASSPVVGDGFPRELVEFTPYEGNPVFAGTGTAEEPWKDWCTNVAMSSDLVHWQKYPNNPLVAGDRSSGIVVHDGDRFRLYTMHPDVRMYWGYREEPSRDSGEHR